MAETPAEGWGVIRPGDRKGALLRGGRVLTVPPCRLLQRAS